MKWGVYDTVDNVWIGDDAGPVLYDNDPDKPEITGEFLAKASAQIVDMRLGQPPGRCRAREWVEQSVRLRDTVDTKMSTLTALERLEGGHL